MTVTGKIERRSKTQVRDLLIPPAKVKVGVLIGTGEHPNATRGQTIIEIAFWNEFGAPNADPPIKERSFLRSTMNENRKKYFALQAKLITALMKGMISREQAVAIMGMQMQSDVQNKIRALRTPPNAPSTKRRKGSSNPLIDTGELFKAIKWAKA
jgi:hypothetical protein